MAATSGGSLVCGTSRLAASGVALARATATAVEVYDGYQNVVAAQQNFQEGNYWTGAYHAGLAVLNVIGVKGGIKQLKNDVHIAAFPGDHCYPAGTPLSTQFGQCPIETVQQDDRVWSFNLLTGQWELCRVVETYSREHEGDLVKVFIAGSAIESTYHHPYWVVEGEDLAERPAPDHVRAITVRDAIVPGRWVDAGDLRIGDVLLLQDGRRLPIEEIVVRQATCRVYNLAVEGLRNYAIGRQSVLAHNMCAAAAKPPKGTSVKETRGGTYVLRDAEEQVVRSGRTKDLLRRKAEHARDPSLKDYSFEPVHRTDVYVEQRGLEQKLHELYNPQLNKIRPISETNPRLSDYIKAAEDFLS
jgi:hypothetical protein